MASSSNPPAAANPPDTPSSFTMIDRDLESIGAHCQYEYCHQLDFLPFRCESCRRTYCLDHRTEDAHACPHAGAWAAARRAAAGGPPSTSLLPNEKPTLATGTQCSEPRCKTYIHTHTSVGVGCAPCGRAYCLRHRLPEDHACATLTPIKTNATTSSTGSGARNPAQKAATALARLRAWGKSKAEARGAAAPAPSTKPTSTAKAPASRPARAAPRAQTAAPALAELKRTATGDARVPPAQRVYLHVEAVADLPSTAPATTTATPNASQAQAPPHAALFVGAEWSVGRLLDAAARALRVENRNNRGGGEAERLRVFHVEGGRLLAFADRVGACGVRSGHTVVLLRGVGPVDAAEG